MPEPADHPRVDREPVTLTIRHACQYTGLSRSFVYKLFDGGVLPRLKAGKRVLIRKDDLDAYLASIRGA